MKPFQRILVAIDTADVKSATTLAKNVAPYVGGIKLGLEFFNHNGATGVNAVLEKINSFLFLDLKFHDIPNTVAGAVRGVMNTAPNIVNVHTAGGIEMMKRAKAEAVAESQRQAVERPLVIGVTILTALDDTDLQDVGYADTMQNQTIKMAKLAKQAGLDGVVCSAYEIQAIKQACGSDFVTVVPGIRPEGSDKSDQKRTLTPAQALEAGADYIVIGRPITQAPDPKKAAKDIYDSVAHLS